VIPAPLGRLAYRFAYVLIVIWSHVARPHTRGVKCLLTCDGDLLLVRHSYGPRKWDLPGGFCKRGEDFEAAARREVAEELGIEGGRYVDLGVLERRWQGRHETLHGFRVELADHSAATESLELAEARWFPIGALPDGQSRIVGEIRALEAGLPATGGG
jgi:ADP-ribose pyrophosphatase YjhB (NUDIX family)